MAQILTDDLITYDEAIDLTMTHLVDVRQLQDGDIIPVGTILLSHWPMWGRA